MWPTGWSWTKGYKTDTTNPDGTVSRANVHGGPFYFNPDLLGRKVFGRYIYTYWGFRPTPTWGVGYGDEGLIGGYSRWLKKIGWGNLATLPTVRFKKVVSN